MVIHDRQLPAPMSLHWSEYAQHLSVQVPSSDFLRWLDALTDVERSTSIRGGRAHYRATGALRGAPEHRVRLSAVGIHRQAVA
jgi:hypothetical protein